MFEDSLEIKLKLTVGKKDLTIPGGHVKTLKLDLQPYGFSCLLTFVISTLEGREDEVFPLFVKPDLMKVRLEVESRWQERKNKPLVLQGLVTAKDILEEFIPEEIRVKGDPTFYRHYQIAFADPAYVLWRQHYPCDLLTNKTVKDLLDAHKGGNVSLKYDWNVLDEKHAINTLPLGIEGSEASFYDFVLWFVSSHDGVWSYDCSKDEYQLSKSKPDGGKSKPLDKLDVEDFLIEFPQTIRNNVAVLNSYSEKAERKVIEQEQAVDGVRHDQLVRLPVASDLEECKKLEEQKLRIRQHEISLTFKRFSKSIPRPGSLYKFEGPGWSDKIFPHGKVYRVRNVFIDAKSMRPELSADLYMDYAGYNIEMRSHLELESERWVSLPPFKPPPFPIYVEGKIVSEQGAKEAETYQIYQDKETSLDQYKVAIPLWKNQEVVVPFEPNFFTGHFYFPDYKEARVLVALDLHNGRIERFLDWRAGARLPMDTQGNHILLGKTDKSQTSVQHVYVDDKPVLHVKRTSEKDTEMIKMVEGSLILETKEEE
ncbi:MAG: hypothetical protein PVF76_16445 [Syntrophobacterales bacterium]|jgi:hypothetical protein